MWLCVWLCFCCVGCEGRHVKLFSLPFGSSRTPVSRIRVVRGGDRQHNHIEPVRRTPPASGGVEVPRNITVIVSVSSGSPHFDKSRRFTVGSNATVLSLKTLLEEKFPGCPPRQLQRLYHGSRLLVNDELLPANVGSEGAGALNAVVALTLDTLPKLDFHTFSKKLISTEQVLQALSTIRGYQVYLENSLHELAGSLGGFDGHAKTGSSGSENSFQLSTYRQFVDFHSANAHRKYFAELGAAATLDRNPVVVSAGSQQDHSLPPAVQALAHYLDLNWSRAWQLLYSSMLCMVS
jgi:hypothetical protein